MKFYIYNLGCKVNSYESRVMADILISNGYIESDDSKNNDICIINTCTVTNTANNKSCKIIRRAINENKNAIIIACGCASQSNPDLIKSIDGVDIVIGTNGKTKIVEYIKEYNGKQLDKVDSVENIPFENMQLKNFDKTRAFVKIQDGCDNFCAYCVIPYTRGNIRSKNRDDVINEITNLINDGHHEIVLTGIHTGSYGREFKNYSFNDLIQDIIKIDGLERIRISSIEITELDDRFLSILKNNKKLVSHMHIPLQSGSCEILKKMNRKYNLDYFEKRIEMIRSVRPDISITTDVIVGFPGESEELFNQTIETVKRIKFSKIHVFPYSKRDKTLAATFTNQISEEEKHRRVNLLIRVSEMLEYEYMNKFIDKKLEFIPEVYKNGYVIGHTGNYLLIKCPWNIESNILGTSRMCLIEKVEYPYCIGRIIGDTDE